MRWDPIGVSPRNPPEPAMYFIWIGRRAGVMEEEDETKCVHLYADTSADRGKAASIAHD